MVAIDVKRSLAVSAVALLATFVLVSVQGEEVIITQPPAQDGLARFRSLFHVDPVVDTGDSELGGRRVYVHVPGGLFDLRLDTRPNNQGLRIVQSVLGNTVHIFMDRTRDATTSRLTGPISVKVFGFTIYQNKEAREQVVPVIPPPTI